MRAIPKKNQTKKSKSEIDKSDEQTDAKRKDVHTDTLTTEKEIEKITDKQTDQSRKTVSKEVIVDKDKRSDDQPKLINEKSPLKVETPKKLEVNQNYVSKETIDSRNVVTENKLSDNVKVDNLRIERSRDTNQNKKEEDQQHEEKETKDIFGKKIFRFFGMACCTIRQVRLECILVVLGKRFNLIHFSFT